MSNFKEKANDVAESAGRTARYVAHISKCRFEILTEKERIRRNYTKLGKVYYKDYITDEEPDEAEYKPLCDAVSESYRRINELKEEIECAKEEYHCVEEEIGEEMGILPLEEATAEA
ncbi:MAG: hypothetical protein IJB35_00410 [Oscillospiraceae bacterium]|nr:hypothetical protein [Oscillospiraceae bacterium]